MIAKDLHYIFNYNSIIHKKGGFFPDMFVLLSPSGAEYSSCFYYDYGPFNSVLSKLVRCFTNGFM